MSEAKQKRPHEGHSVCRGKICVVCLEKSKRPLTPNLINELKKFTNIFEKISPEDERVASGICDPCRNLLRLKTKGKNETKEFRIPSGFNFVSSVFFPKTRSKLDTDCNCFLCNHARSFRVCSAQSSKYGVSKTAKKKKKSKVQEYRCAVCLTLINKGINHDCTDTTLLESLKEIHEKKPLVTGSLSAYVVKSAPASPNGTRRVSQMHGQPFAVGIGPVKPPPEPISHDEVIEHKLKHNLSQRQTKGMATFSNKHGRKVAKGLQNELVRRGHILEDDYHVVNGVLELKDGKMVEKPIVCAKNATDLVNCVFELRNQDQFNYFLKIQLDDGGDYLKLSVNLVPRNDWNNQKKGSKLSGVKKLIPLAFVHKCPENYHNLKTLCDCVDLYGLSGWKIFDYKTRNLFYGIMSNSSTFRCTDCLAHYTNLHVCGEPRTIAQMASDLERFLDAGGNRKLGALFNCQVERPLVCATLAECKECHDSISDHSPPAELHIILGIFNHIKNKMGEHWPKLMEDWVIDTDVSAAGYWQGTFEGNPCKALLENIGFLERAAVPFTTPYINVLKSFNAVRAACFGYVLEDDYAEKITKFRDDYMILVNDFGVSIIVKAHVLFFHVAPWILKYKMPLGPVSEQASETLHSKWKHFILFRNVSNSNSSNFAKNLLKVVVEFASYNI